MTHEQLYLSRSQCFAFQPTGRIPEPPVFVSGGVKYTVPPYYSYVHSETQWLLNMVKGNNWARICRVLAANQCYLSNTYCQIPDSPEPILGQPMFHRKAMLYLTPVALAIYLRQHKLATKMMQYVTDEKERIVDVNQPCFVTNYIERFENRNDIMMIFPFCIMFRRECFECVRPLLENGWCPQEEIEMPYRRISQVFTFHYKDVIEYSLAQMVTKPNLRLPRLLECLIQSYHDNFTLLNFENVVITISNNTEIEDFVSIPRRLLRYVNYYDRDMRVLSQVISSIKIIQRSGFYIGPRRDPLAITFVAPKTGTDEENMINDQDNSIALMLAICDEAELKGHSQSRQKSLDVLAHILVDTKWFVHFLYKDSEILSEYFSNLIERMKKIRLVTIDCARIRLATLIDETEIDMKTIKELYDPNFPKRDWKETLGSYLETNSVRTSNKNNSIRNVNHFKNNSNNKSDLEKKSNSESVYVKSFSKVSVVNIDRDQNSDVNISVSNLL